MSQEDQKFETSLSIDWATHKCLKNKAKQQVIGKTVHQYLSPVQMPKPLRKYKQTNLTIVVKHPWLVGLTLRMCLCASPMVRKSCDKGHTKETAWLWMDGWSHSSAGQDQVGQGSASSTWPGHDQSCSWPFVSCVTVMAVCTWLLSCVCSVCLDFFFIEDISIITIGFPSVIPFSAIYLCKRPLSKGHTEGLEVS